MAHILKCKFCTFSVRSVVNLVKHHFHHRHISRRYHCGVADCKISFQTESSLRSHIIRFHNIGSITSRKPARAIVCDRNAHFVCTIRHCQKGFVDRSEFLKHLKFHIRLGVSTPCPVSGCGQSYKNVQSFTGHMSKYHRSKPTSSPPPSPPSIVAELFDNSSGGSDITSDMFIDNEEEEDLLSFDEEDLSSDRFLETMCQFFMKLEFDLFLPATSVQYVATELVALQIENDKLVEKRLRRKLKDCNVGNIDNIVSYVLSQNPFSNVQEKLKTNYLRKETYKKCFTFVQPICLPTIKKRFHYISLKDTVKGLFYDKSVNFELSPPRFAAKPGLFQDYTDGWVFQNNPFFINNPLALHFILYQDSFEIVVPIGPAKKKYKLLAVYLLIGNIPVHLRSRVNSILLVALCIEKFFDHKSVYGPIVQDLKDLETLGVHVSDRIGTLKGSLVCIVGDNLGQHQLGGFVEQFSTSLFFCRFCRIDRKSYHSEGGELRRFQQRTKESYNRDLAAKEQKKKKIYHGVKFDSIFNKLKYFHVCAPGLSPCLAHDLHEGVVAHDLKLFIGYFVAQEWFSYELLNKALDKFMTKLSNKDKRDAPIHVLEDYPKVKGGAWQVNTFLRLFTLIVKDFILDEDDPVWLTLLLLTEIVEIVLSPATHESYLPYLQERIYDYLNRRKILFPSVLLRPKHHYLSHYCDLIYALGCLIRVFSLRFESKHIFFKRCIRASRNFINPTKSLSVRHELHQAYLRSGNDRHCKVNVVGDIDFFIHTYSEEIQQAIGRKLPPGCRDCLKATVNGIIYQKGEFVIIRQKSYQVEVEMGRIVLILYDNNEEIYLLVENVRTVFIPHLRVYEVGPKISYECISVKDLASAQSLHGYLLGTHLYVKLRFAVVSDVLIE